MERRGYSIQPWSSVIISRSVLCVASSLSNCNDVLECGRGKPGLLGTDVDWFNIILFGTNLDAFFLFQSIAFFWLLQSSSSPIVLWILCLPLFLKQGSTEEEELGFWETDNSVEHGVDVVMVRFGFIWLSNKEDSMRWNNKIFRPAPRRCNLFLNWVFRADFLLAQSASAFCIWSHQQQIVWLAHGPCIFILWRTGRTLRSKFSDWSNSIPVVVGQAGRSALNSMIGRIPVHTNRFRRSANQRI